MVTMRSVSGKIVGGRPYHLATMIENAECVARSNVPSDLQTDPHLSVANPHRSTATLKHASPLNLVASRSIYLPTDPCTKISNAKRLGGHTLELIPGSKIILTRLLHPKTSLLLRAVVPRILAATRLPGRLLDERESQT